MNHQHKDPVAIYTTLSSTAVTYKATRKLLAASETYTGSASLVGLGLPPQWDIGPQHIHQRLADMKQTREPTVGASRRVRADDVCTSQRIGTDDLKQSLNDRIFVTFCIKAIHSAPGYVEEVMLAATTRETRSLLSLGSPDQTLCRASEQRRSHGGFSILPPYIEDRSQGRILQAVDGK